MYFANKAGVANAGFTGIAGQTVAISDAIIYYGTRWYLVPNGTDLNAYVPLAGSNLMTGAIVWTGAAASRAGTTMLNLKGATIDDAALDCGTY
jgi:hypothetical protein